MIPLVLPIGQPPVEATHDDLPQVSRVLGCLEPAPTPGITPEIAPGIAPGITPADTAEATLGSTPRVTFEAPTRLIFRPADADLAPSE
ncbi:MAG: hypothetical protein AAGG38_11465 [Planctomycetota bacterium]